MRTEGEQQLLREGIPAGRIQHNISLDLRYEGQYHELNVPIELRYLELGMAQDIVERFSQSHDLHYGYSLQEDWDQESVRVQVVNVRCTSLGTTVKPRMEQRRVRDGGTSAQKGVRPAYNPFIRRYQDTPVWDGHQLGEGREIEGPSIVELETTTIVVPSGFVLICDDNFLITKQ